MTRLILLNGLPGVGKSTVAAAWAAERPGTLALDIDVVRTLISGAAQDTAEQARVLGLAMAVEHLRGGRDVVVPQLVARTDQAQRFADAATRAGAGFVHVVLEAPRAVVVERLLADGASHRRHLDPATFAGYVRGLREVKRVAGVVRLDTGPDHLEDRGAAPATAPATGPVTGTVTGPVTGQETLSGVGVVVRRLEQLIAADGGR